MKKLTDKEKTVLVKLLNKRQILDFLSSESAEGDEKEFKANYGTSTEFATKALYKLTQTLL